MLIEIERRVCDRCLDQGTEKCKPDCWAILGSEVEEERLRDKERKEAGAITGNMWRKVQKANSTRRDRKGAKVY